MQIHPADTTTPNPNPTLLAVFSTLPNGSIVWPATSLGLPVLRLAAAGPLSLSRLSQHRRVLNLVTPQGDLVAVVEDTAGPGPFNVVVEAWDRFVRAVQPDDTGHLAEGRLVVGQQAISLCQALIWNPDPNWPEIAQSPALAAGLHHLLTWFGQQRLPGDVPLDDYTAMALRQATSQVATPANENDRWQGIVHLLGLGPGLTPVGDDWLAGWLLHQHVARCRDIARCDLPGYPPLDMITPFIAEWAASRTTRLSQAWLRAAAAGWVDGSWRQLLEALVSGAYAEVDRAAARIVQHGVTSGYAMLAGFLQETIA